jgi:hypothetical protein
MVFSRHAAILMIELLRNAHLYLFLAPLYAPQYIVLRLKTALRF